MRRVAWFCSLTAIAAIAAIVPVRTQSALPTRLLQVADLVHQGSFTLPDVQDTVGNYAFEYAQGVLAFNPANNSLFVVGHDWTQQVAEVSIPAFGGTATMIQNFRDPLEGEISLINPTDPNAKKIGGLYLSGNRLVVAAYSYYDGAATATTSHFVRSSTLTTTGVTGPFRVGTENPGWYAGYFGAIPAAWQDALGGTLLNGQCCLGVVTRTSFGPSVSVVSPADLLAAKNPTPANMLVGYPSDHPLAAWESTGPLFNGTTIMRGVVLPEGTATVMFFGRHGMGTYCYGEPGPCNDPEDTGKGTHAYPYEPHVWFYNANDLAAVKAGTKQRYDVKPYLTGRLPGLTMAGIGGVAYDPTTGRLFVSEQFGDGVKLRIHVFTISGSTTAPGGGGTSTPADTTAPSVSVTAPTSGGTLSGTTTLTATASDNVGVTGVWFTVDGVTVGSEDAAAPYTTSWATTALANGVHVIRALARDAAGNIGTSTALSVTLNNLVPDLVAPTVSVTAPAGGSTVSGTVMLSASASDNVGVTSVQFTVDGVNVGGADTAAPYTYSWPTTSSTNGTRLVRAVARDAAGNTTTSSAVSVTVANTPADTTMPTATVTAPASGTTVSGTVSVTATATDNTAVAGVQFTLDGSALGSEDTTAPYAISWATTSATNGTHTLRAVARDPAGNTTTSGSVLVTVNNTTGDTTLPTVALTAPASGATVSGTTTVSASASDNLGVVGVQFTLDNVALGAEDTSAPYSISWATTGTANGPHTLRAIARDAAGNTRTATARTVTVTNLVADTSAPTVTVTAPAANATVAGSVTLTATATDDVGVVGVQFAVDGVNIGAEDTAAPYRSTWSAGTTLNGPHTLSATARDAAGNRRTATTVVTLRNLGSGVAGDLNDDRLPDLVFEHTTGQIYSWQMAAGTMTGGAAFAPAAVNPVWHIVALDDFDGDQKTDILWQNTVNGQVYLWLMDQYTLISEAWVLSADSPWRVMGTADLNGDGKPDILWKQPTTGALAVWYMDGATVVSTGALAPGQIDPNWRLAGTADLNHDGQPDLLWQNRATGALVYWLMHGPTAIQIGSVTPGATNVLWEVRAVADFDRDGQPDLLFQHATTGQLYLWYLNGTTLVRDSFVTPSQVDPNWKIVGNR